MCVCVCVCVCVCAHVTHTYTVAYIHNCARVYTHVVIARAPHIYTTHLHHTTCPYTYPGMHRFYPRQTNNNKPFVNPGPGLLVVVKWRAKRFPFWNEPRGKHCTHSLRV